jgi:hypothetical protein
MGVEVDYYVESPETFGPEWDLKFVIAPIISALFK